MTESGEWIPLSVALVAMVIIAAGLARALLERFRIPALVGFLVIGFLMRAADDRWSFMTESPRDVFEFLAQIGIVTLLFQVGVDSNLAGLIRQLRRAVSVWLGNIVLSAILVFVTVYYVFGFDLIQSMFVSAALTATSVGVVVAVWQAADVLNTDSGELMLDVAELDDISAVLLMTLLLSVAPSLHDGNFEATPGAIVGLVGPVILKAAAFGAVCLAFAHYVEHRLTSFTRSIERPPDPILTILGIAFLIAALGAALGFSIAIGAFFAGLAFSRDPAVVRMETDLDSLIDFFLPFFFVSVGFMVDPAVLGSNVELLAAVLAAAILGKLVGGGVMAWKSAGATTGLLLGVSMIPRAEFTMIVVGAGHGLGPWAVTDELFAATAGVVLITSVFSPIVVRRLLERWPPLPSEGAETCSQQLPAG